MAVEAQAAQQLLGAACPDEGELDLLRAALAPDDQGRAAWTRWRAAHAWSADEVLLAWDPAGADSVAVRVKSGAWMPGWRSPGVASVGVSTEADSAGASASVAGAAGSVWQAARRNARARREKRMVRKVRGRGTPP